MARMSRSITDLCARASRVLNVKVSPASALIFLVSIFVFGIVFNYFIFAHSGN